MKAGPRGKRNHLRRNLVAIALLSGLATAAFGLPGGARADAQATSKRKEAQKLHGLPISRALGVYLTARGRRYFSDNLLDLLSRKGYTIDEGSFGPWHYLAKSPIVLDQLPDGIGAKLAPVKKILTEWLRGFELGDPLIEAQLSGVSYSTHFDHFGVRVDEEATRRLGRPQAVALVFEAEASTLQVESESARAKDHGNAFLGVFGVNQPRLSIATGSQPLRVSIPLTLQLRGDGHLDFEMHDISMNLTDLQFEFGVARPLVLPRVTVTVNGQTLTLNQARLEDKLIGEMPRLIEALQSFADGYGKENLPTLVNPLVNGNYSDLLLTDVNEMDPPGAKPPINPADRYRWGILPEQIGIANDDLFLGFSAFIDDPKAGDPRVAVSRLQVTQAPALDRLDPTTYDAALTVSEDLVNRVLGLGYRRGYYPNIQVPGSQPLDILQAPEFRFDGKGPSDQGKLHLKVLHHADGVAEDIALVHGGQVTFEMDLGARMIHTPDGKVSVAVDSIDVPSLSVYTGSILPGIREHVIKSIAGTLAKANEGLAKQPQVIVDALPIPSQIGGIPILVKDFRVDPHGYLVLYLEYDLQK